MNFEKEAVPGVAVSTAPSLLFATLSASQTPVAPAALERRRRGSGAGGASSASGGGRDSPTHTTRHVSGYAVAEVRAARAALRGCFWGSPAPKIPMGLTPPPRLRARRRPYQ